MAGSDLDGDDYLILWDPIAVEAFTPTPARDYASSSTVNNLMDGVPSQVDALTRDKLLMNKVKNYYIEYMNMNQLGLISNLHLAWSDRHGLESEISKEFATMFYTAVDAAKTGENVQIPHVKQAIVDNEGYPHYMQGDESADYYHGNESKYYRSKSIIGKLYDEVVEFESKLKQKQEEAFSSKREYTKDPDLMLKSRSLYTMIAEKEMECYLQDQLKLMQLELVPHEREFEFEKLIKKYVNRFYEVVKKGDPHHEANLEAVLASAYYEAAYTTAKRTNKDSVLLFCWNVCGPILDRIKADTVAIRQGRQMAITVAPDQMKRIGSKHVFH